MESGNTAGCLEGILPGGLERRGGNEARGGTLGRAVVCPGGLAGAGMLGGLWAPAAGGGGGGAAGDAEQAERGADEEAQHERREGVGEASVEHRAPPPRRGR